MSDSTALVPTKPSADSFDAERGGSDGGPSQSQALTVRDSGAGALYRPPKPGGTARSRVRTAVLLGGSMAIGTGVALGWFGVLPAATMAIGLAMIQVMAQSLHQNRLGQDVMGGIAGGDLDRALHAAEQALKESPSGAMRTLAAANLASVLMQMDRIQEGVDVLERWPPRWPHVPISTVLWRNNRAFAALVLRHDAELAGMLLDDAEARMQKAGARGFGGDHNYRKIASALAGTRALQCLDSGNAKAALSHLERAYELDGGLSMGFRVAERELCRAESLRRLGRKDEALLAAASLADQPLTQRQEDRLRVLYERLGLEMAAPSKNDEYEPTLDPFLS